MFGLTEKVSDDDTLGSRMAFAVPDAMVQWHILVEVSEFKFSTVDCIFNLGTTGINLCVACRFETKFLFLSAELVYL